MQPANAPSPMVSTELPILIEAMLAHSSNANAPMVSTESGIMMYVRSTQPLNA